MSVWLERNRISITQKRLEKVWINKTIALDILFVPYNTEKIRLAYKSKHNFKHENQVTLLMITDAKKLHYLNVKSLSALLRRRISNHKEHFIA